MGQAVSSPTFEPFTRWDHSQAEALVAAFRRHQMPFAADPTVTAALLRTGDRSLEPKAALKWAKRISKAMAPKRQQDELSQKRQTGSSINALSLISGVIAVAGTAEKGPSGGKPVASPSHFLLGNSEPETRVGSPGKQPDAGASSSDSSAAVKARLLFKAFDFMERGEITDTELTMLFTSTWHAVGAMANLGSSSSSSPKNSDDDGSGDSTNSMARNTEAVVSWLKEQQQTRKKSSRGAGGTAKRSSRSRSGRRRSRSRGKSREQGGSRSGDRFEGGDELAVSGGWRKAATRGGGEDDEDNEEEEEEEEEVVVVGEEEFVAWAEAAVGSKLASDYSRHLPDLMFKFNALDHDEYKAIKAEQRARRKLAKKQQLLPVPLQVKQHPDFTNPTTVLPPLATTDSKELTPRSKAASSSSLLPTILQPTASVVAPESPQQTVDVVSSTGDGDYGEDRNERPKTTDVDDGGGGDISAVDQIASTADVVEVASAPKSGSGVLSKRAREAMEATHDYLNTPAFELTCAQLFDTVASNTSAGAGAAAAGAAAGSVDGGGKPTAKKKKKTGKALHKNPLAAELSDLVVDPLVMLPLLCVVTGLPEEVMLAPGCGTKQGDARAKEFAAGFKAGPKQGASSSDSGSSSSGCLLSRAEFIEFAKMAVLVSAEENVFANSGAFRDEDNEDSDGGATFQLLSCAPVPSPLILRPISSSSSRPGSSSLASSSASSSSSKHTPRLEPIVARNKSGSHDGGGGNEEAAPAVTVVVRRRKLTPLLANEAPAPPPLKDQTDAAVESLQRCLAAVDELAERRRQRPPPHAQATVAQSSDSEKSEEEEEQGGEGAFVVAHSDEEEEQGGDELQFLLRYLFDSEAFFVLCAERFEAFDANESGRLEPNEAHALSVDVLGFQRTPWRVGEEHVRSVVKCLVANFTHDQDGEGQYGGGEDHHDNGGVGVGDGSSFDQSGEIGSVSRQQFRRLCRGKAAEKYFTAERGDGNGDDGAGNGMAIGDTALSPSSSSMFGTGFLFPFPTEEEEEAATTAVPSASTSAPQGMPQGVQQEAGNDQESELSDRIGGGGGGDDEAAMTLSRLLNEEHERVSVVLEVVRRNATRRDALWAHLPLHIKAFLDTDEFWEDARRRFMALDVDGDGVLSPVELYPVVCEVTASAVAPQAQQPWPPSSMGEEGGEGSMVNRNDEDGSLPSPSASGMFHHRAVSADHCALFTHCFDFNSDGVLSKAEFASLLRFLVMVAYLSGPEGIQSGGGGLLEAPPSFFPPFLPGGEGEMVPRRYSQSRGTPLLPTVMEIEEEFPSQPQQPTGDDDFLALQDGNCPEKESGGNEAVEFDNGSVSDDGSSSSESDGSTHQGNRQPECAPLLADAWGSEFDDALAVARSKGSEHGQGLDQGLDDEDLRRMMLLVDGERHSAGSLSLDGSEGSTHLKVSFNKARPSRSDFLPANSLPSALTPSVKPGDLPPNPPEPQVVKGQPLVGGGFARSSTPDAFAALRAQTPDPALFAKAFFQEPLPDPALPLQDAAGTEELLVDEDEDGDQEWAYKDEDLNDGFDVDVELTLSSLPDTAEHPGESKEDNDERVKEAFNEFGFSGQQLGWALARSWQAKQWFKPDLEGDGEEDSDLDVLRAVRAAVLDRVEVLPDDDEDENPWDDGRVTLRVSGFATLAEANAFKRKVRKSYMRVSGGGGQQDGSGSLKGSFDGGGSLDTAFTAGAGGGVVSGERFRIHRAAEYDVVVHATDVTVVATEADIAAAEEEERCAAVTELEASEAAEAAKSFREQQGGVRVSSMEEREERAEQEKKAQQVKMAAMSYWHRVQITALASVKVEVDEAVKRRAQEKGDLEAVEKAEAEAVEAETSQMAKAAAQASEVHRRQRAARRGEVCESFARHFERSAVAGEAGAVARKAGVLLSEAARVELEAALGVGAVHRGAWGERRRHAVTVVALSHEKKELAAQKVLRLAERQRQEAQDRKTLETVEFEQQTKDEAEAKAHGRILAEIEQAEAKVAQKQAADAQNALALAKQEEEAQAGGDVHRAKVAALEQTWLEASASAEKEVREATASEAARGQIIAARASAAEARYAAKRQALQKRHEEMAGIARTKMRREESRLKRRTQRTLLVQAQHQVRTEKLFAEAVGQRDLATKKVDLLEKEYALPLPPEGEEGSVGLWCGAALALEDELRTLEQDRCQYMALKGKESALRLAGGEEEADALAAKASALEDASSRKKARRSKRRVVASDTRLAENEATAKRTHDQEARAAAAKLAAEDARKELANARNAKRAAAVAAASAAKGVEKRARARAQAEAAKKARVEGEARAIAGAEARAESLRKAQEEEAAALAATVASEEREAARAAAEEIAAAEAEAADAETAVAEMKANAEEKRNIALTAANASKEKRRVREERNSAKKKIKKQRQGKEETVSVAKSRNDADAVSSITSPSTSSPNSSASASSSVQEFDATSSPLQLMVVEPSSDAPIPSSEISSNSKVVNPDRRPSSPQEPLSEAEVPTAASCAFADFSDLRSRDDNASIESIEDEMAFSSRYVVAGDSVIDVNMKNAGSHVQETDATSQPLQQMVVEPSSDAPVPSSGIASNLKVANPERRPSSPQEPLSEAKVLTAASCASADISDLRSRDDNASIESIEDEMAFSSRYVVIGDSVPDANKAEARLATPDELVPGSSPSPLANPVLDFKVESSGATNQSEGMVPLSPDTLGSGQGGGDTTVDSSFGRISDSQTPLEQELLVDVESNPSQRISGSQIPLEQELIADAESNPADISDLRSRDDNASIESIDDEIGFSSRYVVIGDSVPGANRAKARLATPDELVPGSSPRPLANPVLDFKVESSRATNQSEGMVPLPPDTLGSGQGGSDTIVDSSFGRISDSQIPLEQQLLALVESNPSQRISGSQIPLEQELIADAESNPSQRISSSEIPLEQELLAFVATNDPEEDDGIVGLKESLVSAYSLESDLLSDITPAADTTPSSRDCIDGAGVPLRELSLSEMLPSLLPKEDEPLSLSPLQDSEGPQVVLLLPNDYQGDDDQARTAYYDDVSIESIDDEAKFSARYLVVEHREESVSLSSQQSAASVAEQALVTSVAVTLEADKNDESFIERSTAAPMHLTSVKRKAEVRKARVSFSDEVDEQYLSRISALEETAAEEVRVLAQLSPSSSVVNGALGGGNDDGERRLSDRAWTEHMVEERNSALDDAKAHVEAEWDEERQRAASAKQKAEAQARKRTKTAASDASAALNEEGEGVDDGGDEDNASIESVEEELDFASRYMLTPSSIHDGEAASPTTSAAHDDEPTAAAAAADKKVSPLNTFQDASYCLAANEMGRVMMVRPSAPEPEIEATATVPLPPPPPLGSVRALEAEKESQKNLRQVELEVHALLVCELSEIAGHVDKKELARVKGAVAVAEEAERAAALRVRQAHGALLAEESSELSAAEVKARKEQREASAAVEQCRHAAIVERRRCEAQERKASREHENKVEAAASAKKALGEAEQGEATLKEEWQRKVEATEKAQRVEEECRLQEEEAVAAAGRAEEEAKACAASARNLGVSASAAETKWRDAQEGLDNFQASGDDDDEATEKAKQAQAKEVDDALKEWAALKTEAGAAQQQASQAHEVAAQAQEAVQAASAAQAVAQAQVEEARDEEEDLADACADAGDDAEELKAAASLASADVEVASAAVEEGKATAVRLQGAQNQALTLARATEKKAAAGVEAAAVETRQKIAAEEAAAAAAAKAKEGVSKPPAVAVSAGVGGGGGRTHSQAGFKPPSLSSSSATTAAADADGVPVSPLDQEQAGDQALMAELALLMRDDDDDGGGSGRRASSLESVGEAVSDMPLDDVKRSLQLLCVEMPAESSEGALRGRLGAAVQARLDPAEEKAKRQMIEGELARIEEEDHKAATKIQIQAKCFLARKERKKRRNACEAEQRQLKEAEEQEARLEAERRAEAEVEAERAAAAKAEAEELSRLREHCAVAVQGQVRGMLARSAVFSTLLVEDSESVGEFDQGSNSSLEPGDEFSRRYLLLDDGLTWVVAEREVSVGGSRPSSPEDASLAFGGIDQLTPLRDEATLLQGDNSTTSFAAVSAADVLANDNGGNGNGGFAFHSSSLPPLPPSSLEGRKPKQATIDDCGGGSGGGGVGLSDPVGRLEPAMRPMTPDRLNEERGDSGGGSGGGVGLSDPVGRLDPAMRPMTPDRLNEEGDDSGGGSGGGVGLSDPVGRLEPAMRPMTPDSNSNEERDALMKSSTMSSDPSQGLDDMRSKQESEAKEKKDEEQRRRLLEEEEAAMAAADAAADAAAVAIQKEARGMLSRSGVLEELLELDLMALEREREREEAEEKERLARQRADIEAAVAAAAAEAFAAAEVRRQAADAEAAAEASRLAEEAIIAEEARKVEEARLAEEAIIAEEARKVEEARLVEEAIIAEEARKAEEARLVEEAIIAEEARKAEEARLVEEVIIAEEARKAEEARLVEEAIIAEEARKAEEARLVEEAIIAEETRKAEEVRLAEEARIVAEKARLAVIARIADEARIAEERRLAEIDRRVEEARLAQLSQLADTAALEAEAAALEARTFAQQAQAAAGQETITAKQFADQARQKVELEEEGEAQRLALQDKDKEGDKDFDMAVESLDEEVAFSQRYVLAKELAADDAFSFEEVRMFNDDGADQRGKAQDGEVPAAAEAAGVRAAAEPPDTAVAAAAAADSHLSGVATAGEAAAARAEAKAFVAEAVVKASEVSSSSTLDEAAATGGGTEGGGIDDDGGESLVAAAEALADEVSKSALAAAQAAQIAQDCATTASLAASESDAAAADAAADNAVANLQKALRAAEKASALAAAAQGGAAAAVEGFPSEGEESVAEAAAAREGLSPPTDAEGSYDDDDLDTAFDSLLHEEEEEGLGGELSSLGEESVDGGNAAGGKAGGGVDTGVEGASAAAAAGSSGGRGSLELEVGSVGSHSTWLGSMGGSLEDSIAGDALAVRTQAAMTAAAVVSPLSARSQGGEDQFPDDNKEATTSSASSSSPEVAPHRSSGGPPSLLPSPEEEDFWLVNGNDDEEDDDDDAAAAAEAASPAVPKMATAATKKTTIPVGGAAAAGGGGGDSEDEACDVVPPLFAKSEGSGGGRRGSPSSPLSEEALALHDHLLSERYKLEHMEDALALQEYLLAKATPTKRRDQKTRLTHIRSIFVVEGTPLLCVVSPEEYDDDDSVATSMSSLDSWVGNDDDNQVADTGGNEEEGEGTDGAASPLSPAAATNGSSSLPPVFVLKSLTIHASNPDSDDDFPCLVIKDRDVLSEVQACRDEAARMAFLGQALRFGFGGRTLSLCPTADRLLLHDAPAAGAVDDGAGGGSAGASGAGGGPFFDAAVKEELEGKRAQREKKRQAALAKCDASLGAFDDAEEEDVPKVRRTLLEMKIAKKRGVLLAIQGFGFDQQLRSA